MQGGTLFKKKKKKDLTIPNQTSFPSKHPICLGVVLKKRKKEKKKWERETLGDSYHLWAGSLGSKALEVSRCNGTPTAIGKLGETAIPKGPL